MNDRRRSNDRRSRPVSAGSGARRQVGEVAVFETRDALMKTAAERFVASAARAIEQSGRFVVALSGGSTPRGMYSLLAAPPCAARVEWSRVHVFWSDERCVPPDDPVSNYRTARQALLDHVPAAETNVHRIAGEKDPDVAARSYESELREFFRAPDGQPQAGKEARFDLILLGMGEDGHTASIFPGSAAVHETRRWVVAECGAAIRPPRVTLTPPLINAAAAIVFLVAGPAKAPVLHRVLQGPYEPDRFPAQIVVPSAGRLEWLIDAAAAADLETPNGE